jgi:DNA (cytosine-5)-methyltransferase 1
MSVPVIDLFAGPGGLGEGFNRSTAADFHVAVSIEKDGMAFETLRLRAAHRALLRSGQASPATWLKWDQALAEHPWNILFDTLSTSSDPVIAAACLAAKEEAWHLELGPATREEVSDGIRRRLRPYSSGSTLPKNSVLIGGPPCQAYSIVGRSRNRGTRGYKPEEDHRHFLYLEYLHVINHFRPAVFIMENVKGILTSKVLDRQLFRSILTDLKRPDRATGEESGLEYELVALGRRSNDLFEFEPQDFIVQAESHGIPQARHRVIICGIRQDIFKRAGWVGHLKGAEAPSVKNVIADLPPLRGGISFRGRGIDWLQSFDGPLLGRALRALSQKDDAVSSKVARRMESAYAAMQRRNDPGTGDDRLFMGQGAVPRPLATPSWYKDRPLALLANHESRAHMPSDLVRYLFASAFGDVTGVSPRLHDFPVCLLPSHKNVDPRMPQSAIFKDRFRVQIADYHSMTVTSHIAKDGHAFIHYDPVQCRSLTVREAARIQTFPDSYVFLGNRTSQYTQVGNAVPPLLARQIADVVAGVLERAGVAKSKAKEAADSDFLPKNRDRTTLPARV